MSDRLQKQVEFILELDKLKKVMRRTFLLDQSRNENDAEHSWHVTMMALIFAEYAPAGVDISRVMRMLLIHDIVEIDAGDTFVYDETHLKSKEEREQKAAKRIYGILPQDLGAQLLALWGEFEEQKTQDAIFAASLDRIQPVFHNYYVGGGAWLQHKISAEQVRSKIMPVLKRGPETLYQLAENMINDAVKKGYLVG